LAGAFSGAIEVRLVGRAQIGVNSEESGHGSGLLHVFFSSGRRGLGATYKTLGVITDRPVLLCNF
jgi:hypothetical protein